MENLDKLGSSPRKGPSMNVLTKAIFPALRIILWAIIAIALVKIGFFPPSNETANPDDDLFPGSDFSQPTTFVERTTITDDIAAPATVIADPSREQKTNVSGYVGYWARANGERVAQGQPIVEVRVPLDENNPNLWTRHTFEAPIGGILTRSVALNADVNDGDVLFTISPTTMSIEATLSPEERYRLEEDPTSAQIRINGGPEPFECTTIRMGDPVTSDDTTPPNDDEFPEETAGDTTSFTMSCAAPTDIRLVVGLTGSMVVSASEAKDILVVPTTAVQTDGVTSQVFQLDPATGETTSIQVTLGITDGSVIEVVDGLAEGDEILMFAPGNLEPLPSEDFNGDGIIDDGDIIYEDEGVVEEGEVIIDEGEVENFEDEG